jgi:hypothetical protein
MNPSARRLFFRELVFSYDGLGVKQLIRNRFVLEQPLLEIGDTLLQKLGSGKDDVSVREHPCIAQSFDIEIPHRVLKAKMLNGVLLLKLVQQIAALPQLLAGQPKPLFKILAPLLQRRHEGS